MSDRSQNGEPQSDDLGGAPAGKSSGRAELGHINSGRSQFDALLIIGHGTRDPAGLAEFQTLVEQVTSRKKDWVVSGCYLELAEPSIQAAVDRLVDGGHRHIRAMPLVLFSAGHAKRDIPEALRRAALRQPGLSIDLCPALGCHPSIVELSAERCRQALDRPAPANGAAIFWEPIPKPSGRGGQSHFAPRTAQNWDSPRRFSVRPVAADETLLVLVGRGGSDAEALAEMQRLADLRRAAAATAGEPLGRVEVAFAAVAEPPLASVLEQAAQSSFRRIVVQPHLLFAGRVLDEIRGLVERRRQAGSASHSNGGPAAADRLQAGRQWIVTDVLGPDPRLVAAVIDRVSQTAAGGGLTVR